VLDSLTKRELELSPTLDAWAQQPAERDRNYGLFTMYRDSGRLRSVAQVAGMIDDLSYPTLTRIARYNKWAERAALWDADQDRIMSIRLQTKREEMAERHAKAASALLEKAMERLRSLDVDSISPHALVLMLDTAARIERSALGLETLGKGTAAQQSTVTVAATTKTNAAGQTETRVETIVQHDRIMGTLDEMVKRMSPEQLAAGYEELAASAEEATRELDAALPAPPPQ
jgi:hypothetical protein